MPNTMHSLETNPSNVPAFLTKLWRLVEDSNCDDLIAWSNSGYSFIIKDQVNFAKDLLPRYFKHNNMASFVRQLNMYGFKKVMNIEKSGLKADNMEIEFQHSFFVKNRSDLLELIKRKLTGSHQKIAGEPPPAKTNADEILVDLSSIRQKQESMDSMLLKMKSENELLWRELTTMRQKHKAQEQIIQKVIQFLVSIVQRNNPNIGVQRKISRMLHSSPNTKENSCQMSRTIDVLRKNNSDCILVPEQIVSPLGPVIHEVLDTEQEDNLNSPLGQCVASPSVKSPEGAKEATESAIPKYNFVSLLNSNSTSTDAIEPLKIFEALTPRTAITGESEESILGLSLDYVTAPDDTESVSTVTSICDSVHMNNAQVGNIISIPESGSLNDIITLSPDGSIVDSLMLPEVTVETSPGSDKASVSSPHGSDFLANRIPSLSDMHPSTSKTSYEGDFHDDLMSESLHTPKVHTIDEDPFMSPPIKLPKINGPAIKSEFNPSNCQLATTDSSSLAKNVLSNHLLSVDEKLNFTQDRLASNPWNFDIQKLLGLFSTDELVNTDSFDNSLPDDVHIKTEPCDITGNELVQFSPHMLDVDIANTPLFEGLSENPEILNDELSYEPLLSNVLNEPDNSEGVYILPDNMQETKKVKQQKAQNSGKNKRRRVK